MKPEKTKRQQQKKHQMQYNYSSLTVEMMQLRNTSSN